MKNKSHSQKDMKKDGEIVFSDKNIFKIVLIVFVILLIPLLIISIYDIPSVDDFSYGANTRNVWLNTHSIVDVLKESTKYTIDTYKGWQGSFAAVFLFTLQPAVFGEQWYFITPIIMLLILAVGIYALSRQVYGNIIGANRMQYCFVALLSYIICVQFIPSPSEGLYWYNGAIYYTFFFGISLILYAGLLDCIKQSGTRLCVELLLLSALSFFVAGGNLMTGPITGIVYVLLFLYLVADEGKRKGIVKISIPFVFYCTGMLINILAPGNANRMATDGVDTTLFGSIIKSFVAAFQVIIHWTSLPMICLMVFMMPILYKIAISCPLSFRWPGVVALVSYSLIAATLFSPLFAIDYVADRGLNIVFFTYTNLLIFNVFYFAGWIARTFPKNKWQPAYTFSFTFLVPIALVIFTLIFRFNVTSVSALHSLISGEAKLYHTEASERLVILNDDSIKDAVLPAYSVEPYVLYFDDITGDPTNHRNVSMQSFYKKDSVVCAHS